VNISTLATLLALSTPVTADDVEPIQVPVAGDDDGAKSVVGDPLGDLGLQPVDIGRLAEGHFLAPGGIARAALAATHPLELTLAMGTWRRRRRVTRRRVSARRGSGTGSCAPRWP
jgi:hypothetical protein